MLVLVIFVNFNSKKNTFTQSNGFKIDFEVRICEGS